jgi:hypothetical protein
VNILEEIVQQNRIDKEDSAFELQRIEADGDVIEVIFETQY